MAVPVVDMTEAGALGSAPPNWNDTDATYDRAVVSNPWGAAVEAATTLTEIEGRRYAGWVVALRYMVLESESPWEVAVLPMQHASSHKMRIGVTTYESELMHDVPEGGAVDLMRQSRSYRTVNLVRRAVGWVDNLGALMRDEGRADASAHIMQAQQAAIREIRMQVQVALTAARDLARLRLKVAGAAPPTARHLSLLDKRDHQTTGILQRKGCVGLNVAVQAARADLATVGVTADTLVLPYGADALLVFGDPISRDFTIPTLRIGPGKDTERVMSLRTLTGSDLAVVDAGVFNVADSVHNINLMERYVTLGSHVVAGGSPIGVHPRAGEAPDKRARWVQTMDFESSVWHTHETPTLLQHNQRFVESGTWKGFPDAVRHSKFWRTEGMPKMSKVGGDGHMYDGMIVSAGLTYPHAEFSAQRDHDHNAPEADASCPAELGVADSVFGTPQDTGMLTLHGSFCESAAELSDFRDMAIALESSLGRGAVNWAAIEEGLELMTRIAGGEHAIANAHGVALHMEGIAHMMGLWAVGNSWLADVNVVDLGVATLPPPTAESGIPAWYGCWAGMLQVQRYNGNRPAGAARRATAIAFIREMRALATKLERVTKASIFLDPRLCAMDAAGRMGEAAMTLCDTLLVPRDVVPVLLRARVPSGAAAIAAAVNCSLAATSVAMTPFLLSASLAAQARFATTRCVVPMTASYTCAFMADDAGAIGARARCAAYYVDAAANPMKTWTTRMRTLLVLRMNRAQFGATTPQRVLYAGAGLNAAAILAATGAAVTAHAGADNLDNGGFVAMLLDATVASTPLANNGAINAADRNHAVLGATVFFGDAVSAIPQCAAMRVDAAAIDGAFGGAIPPPAARVGRGHWDIIWDAGGGGAAAGVAAVAPAIIGDLPGDGRDMFYRWLVWLQEGAESGMGRPARAPAVAWLQPANAAAAWRVDPVARLSAMATMVINAAFAGRVEGMAQNPLGERLCAGVVMGVPYMSQHIAAMETAIGWGMGNHKISFPEWVWRSYSAVLLRGGPTTGVMLWGDSQLLVGKDISSEKQYGRFMIWLAAVVTAERNVTMIRDMMLAGQLSGHDSTYRRGPWKKGVTGSAVVEWLPPAETDVPAVSYMSIQPTTSPDGDAAGAAGPSTTSTTYYADVYGYGAGNMQRSEGLLGHERFAVTAADGIGKFVRATKTRRDDARYYNPALGRWVLHRGVHTVSGYQFTGCADQFEEGAMGLWARTDAYGDGPISDVVHRVKP